MVIDTYINGRLQPSLLWTTCTMCWPDELWLWGQNLTLGGTTIHQLYKISPTAFYTNRNTSSVTSQVNHDDMAICPVGEP